MQMQAYPECRHILNTTTQLTYMLSLLSLPIYILKKYILYRGYSTIRRHFVKQNLGQRHFLVVPKRRPAVPFGTAGAVWDGAVPHQRRTGYACIFARMPASPGYACISQAASSPPRKQVRTWVSRTSQGTQGGTQGNSQVPGCSGEIPGCLGDPQKQPPGTFKKRG
jgi:hypothetical protein